MGAISNDPTAFGCIRATVCAALLFGSFVASCGGSSDDDDAASTNEEVAAQIEDFFTTGETTSGSIEAGGKFELSDGGTIGIPQGESAGLDVTVTEAPPTEDGVRAFTEWHTDTELAGPVIQLTFAAHDSALDYLIITRPKSEPNSRIFAAGYVDLETGDPDWTPVPSDYDAEAGTVTAAVGLAAFQPLGLGEPQAHKLAAPVLANVQTTTYVGYVAVGVGGQSLKSEVELVVEDPSEALERPVDAPFIPVQAQVAARLIHVTHEPLEALTVTSDFGPRPVSVQGASSNHRGVDYRAAKGTNVYAAGDGTVTIARCQLSSVRCGRTAGGGITGGFYVEITHGDGEATRYFHMTNPATVSVGDAVTAGQVIGLSDSTGGVAPHLHFEVLKNGVYIDPELIFNEQVTTTIAMAIDYRIQEGTKQEVNLVLGKGHLAR